MIIKQVAETVVEFDQRCGHYPKPANADYNRLEEGNHGTGKACR